MLTDCCDYSRKLNFMIIANFDPFKFLYNRLFFQIPDLVVWNISCQYFNSDVSLINITMLMLTYMITQRVLEAGTHFQTCYSTFQQQVGPVSQVILMWLKPPPQLALSELPDSLSPGLFTWMLEMSVYPQVMQMSVINVLGVSLSRFSRSTCVGRRGFIISISLTYCPSCHLSRIYLISRLILLFDPVGCYDSLQPLVDLCTSRAPL